MAYKILWYSIPSLLDTSSGAAIRCKLMLEKLSARGVQVVVLSAACTDDPQGLGPINQVRAQIQPTVKIGGHNAFYQFNLDGIEYLMHDTEHHDLDEIKGREQTELFISFTQLLETYQPDLVMTYSADVFSCVLRAEAHNRGIPVVYALCNGSHLSFGFSSCDMVFTTSKATSELYDEVTGVKVEHVGNFIEPEKVVAAKERRNPRYVTLINPSPSKGISVFVKLALAYTKKHPEQNQEFLIVKSRGDYNQIMCSLHYADGTSFVTPENNNPLPMVSVADHTDNIAAVYAVSKVVVAPSLWHESWGRVVTEANFNDIPVLGSNNGGIPEAMAYVGGICVDPPASSSKDYLCMPTDEEIAPWVEALEKLLSEDYTERCQEATRINNIEASVDRLYNLLEPYMKQGQENKHVFQDSYYHNQKYLNRRNPNKDEQAKAGDSKQAQAAAEPKEAAKTTSAKAASAKSAKTSTGGKTKKAPTAKK